MQFSSRPLAARLGVLSGLLLLAACEKDSDTRIPPVTPTAVTFSQAGLYPEGTQYDDQQGRFLVSSETAGRIGQVRDNGRNDRGKDGKDTTYATGAYSVFTNDDLLISSIGLKLDVPRGRLLVAVSDPGYNPDRTSATTLNKLARLVVFDRSNGTRISSVELSAQAMSYPSHFANDIAIDNQGSAYVTDSFAPVIYKVTFDSKGVGAGTIFSTATDTATVAALTAPAGKFGLNGIVYHPNGYLLVANSAKGTLLKVTVPTLPTPSQPNPLPIRVTKVTLPAGLSLLNADGLQLIANTTLLAVCNTQGKVYQLTSTDDFVTVASPKSYDTGGGYPTTLARRADNTSYVLQAHLDALQATPRQTPPVSDYALKKVVFP
ncbi:SMP-30/gluconolactonase/LRE family protein [Hymenobacter arcticus]